MTTELKIDTNALMTLFPEGTELRLKLQQSVLTECSRRVIRGMEDSKIRNIMQEVARATQSEIGKEFATTVYAGYSNQVNLRPEFVNKIRDAVKTKVGEVVQDALKEATLNLDAKVAHALDTTVKIRVSTMVREEIKSQMGDIDGLIKEAVRATITKSFGALT